jgi:hypothetical protein
MAYIRSSRFRLPALLLAAVGALLALVLVNPLVARAATTGGQQGSEPASPGHCVHTTGETCEILVLEGTEVITVYTKPPAPYPTPTKTTGPWTEALVTVKGHNGEVATIEVVTVYQVVKVCDDHGKITVTDVTGPFVVPEHNGKPGPVPSEVQPYEGHSQGYSPDSVA